MATIEWEEAHTHLREVIELPTDAPIPQIPRGASASASSSTIPPSGDLLPGKSDGKRKASVGDNDLSPESDSEVAKRSKPDAPVPTPNAAQADVAATTLAHARAAATYIPFLTVESLLPPKMPTKEEMEGVLLELRKRALVEEYFGN